MSTASDYLDLITSEHADKPLYLATITTLVNGFVDQINLDSGLILLFDVDTAQGEQLDVLGVWIGFSRQVSTLLDAYFSFDDAALGFDLGTWKGPYDSPYGFSLLDDATYRIMLKAKIGANIWDGTRETMQIILDAIFVGTGLSPAIIDNQDMSIDVILFGPLISVVLATLLTDGYVPLKPAGVRINYALSTGPIFGFDSSTSFVAGFDTGTWLS
jgi:hypothetical protein